ncbi:hypothetical protein RYH73_02385 [Olivibacter sp. CPCC 100613]|uniref:hypothetical protein n=1 Tax=Olivibacter sp. CPCC 100613 TaxID=3079931 RepID=UPI002FF87C9F
MTFEDFFIKKRIDLHQLEKAEPQLYSEFKSHFELMGEKSFDHTKKFWFNRLRKNFHLSENVTVSSTPITSSSLDENKAVAAAESPQAVKPTGFKPRFKAASSSEETKPALNKEIDTERATKAPVGFKPRFKAGQSAPLKGNDVENEPLKDKETPGATPIDTTEQVSKPTGFKPRFRAGVTKKEITAPEEKESLDPLQDKKINPKEESDTETQKVGETKELSKPVGFKPRFKAGVTNKTATESSPKEQEPSSVQEIKEDKPNEAAEKPQGNETAKPKPLGFKPRFKAGTTKNTSPEKENTSADPESLEKTTHTQSDEGDNAKTIAKPLGFKPRFKPGAKKEDSDDQS